MRGGRHWIEVAWCAVLAAAVAVGCATTASRGAGGQTAPPHAGAAPDSMAAEAGAEPMMVVLTPDEQRLVYEFDGDMSTMERDLGAVLAMSGGPDCGRAADLADRICELAERICDIAERHPEHEDVAEQCRGGQRLCDHANASVARACGG